MFIHIAPKNLGKQVCYTYTLRFAYVNTNIPGTVHFNVNIYSNASETKIFLEIT